jgi:hypothetical protein
LFRVAPRIAAVVSFTSLWVSVAVPALALDRALVRCQQAVAKSAAAFLARGLGELDRCANRALDCVETASGDSECLPAVAQRCTRVVERLARREHHLAHAIAARCRQAEPDGLLAPDVLGFGALADVCPALAEPRGDAVAVGTCVAGLVRCAAERMTATALPRMGELLRVAGVSESARASLRCLDDRGGGGEGDAAHGDAIAHCSRSTARVATRLTGRTLAAVAVCSRAALPCVGTRDDDPTCVGPATVACTRAFARIANARRALGAALAAACGEVRVPFAALAEPRGANLDALADECGDVGVEELTDAHAHARCLARVNACTMDGLVHRMVPRTDEILELTGQSLGATSCPGPAPSATATPPPTPTATFTGPTRTPRPGETATPTPSATPTRSATPTPTRTKTPRPTPTATPVCGNGAVEAEEECDGGNFDGETCDTYCFDEPDPETTPRCRNDCTIDFGPCAGTDCEY